MSNIHKTAIIGTGYWGSIIFNTLSKITKKKIYIFDINKENSSLLKRRFKNRIIVAKNIEEILGIKEISNIILATHPSVNFNLGKKILFKKKNLFIEKPIVTNKKKLKILIKTAKENNKILMGGYIYIFNSYIKKIKEILKNKELGKIKYIEIQRKNLGPIRNEVDAHLDLGSHDLSILKYLFNKKLKIKNIIKKKILKKNISDITSINLSIGKINCEIISSWLNPTKERKILIIGSKKMLLFDEMDDQNKLKVFNKYAYYPKLTKFKKNYISNKARIYTGKTRNVKIKENDPLKNELKHFEKSCKIKKNPEQTGNFA
jgi:predicted dehydrogenase